MRQILINYMKKFTDISDDDLSEIAKQIPIESFKKGEILLHQGDIPTKCFFVLQGIVRQYAIDDDGKETTFNFYDENQSITIFNDHLEDKSSKYSLSCIEDSILVVGDLSIEQDMYDANPILLEITRSMMVDNMGSMQDDFAIFMASTPEERYKNLKEKRPELLERVPQHQLASYLGITPESLSRIKRRIEHDYLRIVD